MRHGRGLKCRIIDDGRKTAEIPSKDCQDDYWETIGKGGGAVAAGVSGITSEWRETKRHEKLHKKGESHTNPTELPSR